MESRIPLTISKQFRNILYYFLNFIGHNTQKMVAKEVDLKEQSAEKYNVKLKDNRYLNKDINNKSDVKVSTANAKRKLASPKVGKF